MAFAAGGTDRRHLLRLAVLVPLVAIVAALLLLTLFCRQLLAQAELGVAADTGNVLYVAATGFFLVAAGVVALQARRVAHRVAGPEYRLIEALRRIRGGDLAFRVNLRRGDLLTDLAAECNELLDWLNRNPPAGARTGTDVVDVEDVELQPLPAEVEAP